MEFIKLQIEITLRRATTLSEQSLQSVMTGIERRWIEYIVIYGLDASEGARSEFVMKIDWERHALHIANGADTVTISERWHANAAPEVLAMTKLFNDYVESNDLRVNCRVAYRGGVDRDAANRQLGNLPAQPVRWAGDRSPWTSPIQEADELILELYLVP